MHTTRIQDLHKLANYDLLYHLWHQLQRVQIVFRKAHALAIPADDIETTWHKLGNEAADQTAKAALKHLQHSIPLHEDVSEHKAKLMVSGSIGSTCMISNRREPNSFKCEKYRNQLEMERVRGLHKYRF